MNELDVSEKAADAVAVQVPDDVVRLVKAGAVPRAGCGDADIKMLQGLAQVILLDPVFLIVMENAPIVDAVELPFSEAPTIWMLELLVALPARP